MSNQWISVDDRLPENEDFYLVYLLDGHSDTHEIEIKWWDKEYVFLSWNPLDDITHWMPLPEPPNLDN